MNPAARVQTWFSDFLELSEGLNSDLQFFLLTQ